MSSRNIANLPLHSGAAPVWLFRRMVEMSGAIGTLIVRDEGPAGLLRRLSDPFWFQAFGCVLGFDWHSSGVTTTVCGALKEAARKYRGDLSLFVCGGKGRTSRKTPDDIRRACAQTGDAAETLVKTSKLIAKVDSAAIQDGYQLYHHCFFLIPGGSWCVVQQGMNTQNRYARRYHWLSSATPSFVRDPHAAVACDERRPCLNLVAGEGENHRRQLTDLSKQHPDRLMRELQPFFREERLPLFEAANEESLSLPPRHALYPEHLQPLAVKKVLLKTYEAQASTFEALLGEPGIGPQALRSLSLLAEVIYNVPACRRDPAAYSFAHGGKDGHPYHVNRPLYDANIERLRETINRAKIGHSDKSAAMKSLARFTERL